MALTVWNGCNRLCSYCSLANDGRRQTLSHWLLSCYSLRSLTRLRDFLVRQPSFYPVKITNVPDHTSSATDSAKLLCSYLRTMAPLTKCLLWILSPTRSCVVLLVADFPPRSSSNLRLFAGTVGESNEIFEFQLSSLLSLYKLSVKEMDSPKQQMTDLICRINPHSLSIPGMGPLSAAVMYAEFGNISRFASPEKMPAWIRDTISPGICTCRTYGKTWFFAFTLRNLCNASHAVQRPICWVLCEEACWGKVSSRRLYTHGQRVDKRHRLWPWKTSLIE